MKKAFLILTMAAFVFGCAKKNTPTAASGASSPSGNSGKVVSGNAPSTAAPTTTATTGATPAATQQEGTGAKTPAAPSTTASPEVQGQSTYNAKCGKCHGLKVVGDYTADRWASIMAVMGPKARLNETETANVNAYVKANAKR